MCHKLSKELELQSSLLFRHQASLEDYYNIFVKARWQLWVGLSYSQQEYVSMMAGLKLSQLITAMISASDRPGRCRREVMSDAGYHAFQQGKQESVHVVSYMVTVYTKQARCL